MAPNCRLQPFDLAAADAIAGWATDPDEVRRWCSSPIAPVPAPVVAGWSNGVDVEAHVLTADDHLVAYGELWIDRDEQEVELAHLIVHPAQRRRGLGRALVDALVDRSSCHFGSVFLRVLPENHAAIGCYSSAGFEPVERGLQDEWNRGQPSEYVWMARSVPAGRVRGRAGFHPGGETTVSW